MIMRSAAQNGYLININSAEGEHEFTMDEVEIIQTHLVAQAGEDTDVILGLGYDNSLGDQLGITLIATGFQHKDPFTKPEDKKPEVKKEEKIVMVLKQADERTAPVKEEKKMVVETKEDLLAPKLVDEFNMQDAPMPGLNDAIEMDFIKEEEPIVLWHLKENGKTPGKTTVEERENTVGKMLTPEKKDVLYSVFHTSSVSHQESTPLSNDQQQKEQVTKDSTSTSNPMPAASGGYQLARPSNIYAESKAEVSASKPSVEKPVSSQVAAKSEDELSDLQMQLVEKDIPAADMPIAHHAHTPLSTEVEDFALRNEADEQKRRAAERLHKLRNLSFNVNSADPNNEFETVPAYIRRNMELYNSTSHIENFYSNYEVRSDENNQAQISTINTFLDGKKPD